MAIRKDVSFNILQRNNLKQIFPTQYTRTINEFISKNTFSSYPLIDYYYTPNELFS